ncbi:MAG TPA: superinfection immunity protein [Dehalococcoidia bacterium]|nr:superinfection immunity protein [Dehalococcoidia bacterium]
MKSAKSIRLIILGAFVFLLLLCFTSCAAPVIHTPSDWSFQFTFPYWGFPFGIIGLAIYILPTIIAAVRRHKSIVAILLVNIFLGWTFIGWVLSLIWALIGKA